MNTTAARGYVTGSPGETPTDTRCHLEIIDSAWGFSALRAEWNSLLRASASASPFLTWEWLHTWWQQLGGASTLPGYHSNRFAGDDFRDIPLTRIAQQLSTDIVTAERHSICAQLLRQPCLKPRLRILVDQPHCQNPSPSFR